MASMSKTKTGSYRVQWYEGKKKCQRTFAKRDEAKTFAAELELAPETRRSKILVRELLRQYRETETPKTPEPMCSKMLITTSFGFREFRNVPDVLRNFARLAIHRSRLSSKNKGRCLIVNRRLYQHPQVPGVKYPR